jgi:hypothetical protein
MLSNWENDLRASLKARYPGLSIIRVKGSLRIEGLFPVTIGNECLKKYLITINFVAGGPTLTEPPVVREIGDAIPKIGDRHIDEQGNCCLYMPEYFYVNFAGKVDILSFLDGPVRGYFSNQYIYEHDRTLAWQSGEYSHGAPGILEYYQELLEIEDSVQVLAFIRLIGSNGYIDGGKNCYCNKRKIRECPAHWLKVNHYKKIIPYKVAANSHNRIARLAATKS